MNELKSLYIIYNFLPVRMGNETNSRYKIVRFFGDGGVLGQEDQKKIFGHVVDATEVWPHFPDLELLSEYGVKLCEAVDASKVYLLSAQDYGLGIESIHDSRGLMEVFEKYASQIDLQSDQRKRKSLLGKFFN